MRTALAAPHTAALDAARASGGNALDVALAAATTLIVAYSHQNAPGRRSHRPRPRPGRHGARRAVRRRRAASASTSTRSAPPTSACPARARTRSPCPASPPAGTRSSKLGATLPLSRPPARRGHARRGRACPSRRTSRVRSSTAPTRSTPTPGCAPSSARPRRATSLRQPALAATLRTVADDGHRRDLRWGDRRALAAFLASARLRDDHRRPRRPRGADHRAARRRGARRDVARRAAPDAGRTLLSMLAGVEDGRLDLHRARAANAARDHLLGDPHGGEIDVEALRDARAPEDSGVMASPRASGDTVAMTAVDEEGRAVTLIQSLYAHFGSGLLEPETGIVLHNRGGGFSLERGPPRLPRPRRAPAAHAVPVDGPRGRRDHRLRLPGRPRAAADPGPGRRAVADPSSDLQAAVGAPALDRRRRRPRLRRRRDRAGRAGRGRAGGGGGERRHRASSASTSPRQGRPRAGVAPGARRAERRARTPARTAGC